MAQQNQDSFQNKLVEGEPGHAQTKFGSIVVPHDAEVVTMQPAEDLLSAANQTHAGPRITGNEVVVTDEVNRMSPAATHAIVRSLSKPNVENEFILATMNPSQPPRSYHHKL